MAGYNGPTADDYRPLLARATTRAELSRLWREVNEALGECGPEEYDELFELRCEIEEARS